MPTLNLVALPVVAGLMAGTGVVAAYVTGPISAPPAVTASAVTAPAVVLPAETSRPAGQPCAAQTWPYLDAKCLTRVEARPVRVVTAPRADEASDSPAVEGQPASVPAQDQLAPGSGLTSNDTVLYQPDVVTPPTSQTHTKRARERSQRLVRSYRVPSEDKRGSGALIVVRPLRLDAFR